MMLTWAAVALDILPMLEAEAKERQRAVGGNHGNQHTGGQSAVMPISAQAAEPGLAIGQATKIVGASKTYRMLTPSA